MNVCDEGPISSVDNCENDYDEDTSFSLSMLTDDSWFDDKIRNDRIRLQQYISEASVSMETLIGTCLHTLGDNTRLTPAAQNYLMYQIRQAISISMLKLEGDVRSIFKKKEDLVLDVTDAYKVKLAQANDSHIRMQKRYEMMLSTADNKMLKQFEEISYLEKKMRSRINF
ncbi:uncharacterized protein [Diabrotica undecimpunctata]|uniref:uncharacterized protein n=1 Tax=Diabrotica undecimpunctata TaxID=50387 RepID=UPI003B63B73F